MYVGSQTIANFTIDVTIRHVILCSKFQCMWHDLGSSQGSKLPTKPSTCSMNIHVCHHHTPPISFPLFPPIFPFFHFLFHPHVNSPNSLFEFFPSLLCIFCCNLFISTQPLDPLSDQLPCRSSICLSTNLSY